jgi:hypothetical protein
MLSYYDIGLLKKSKAGLIDLMGCYSLQASEVFVDTFDLSTWPAFEFSLDNDSFSLPR